MRIKKIIQLAALGVALSFSAVTNAQTITLANGEWAPYMSPKLKSAGYVSDIVTQAFKEEGIDVKWAFLPWKRGYEQAKSGKLQGTAIWSYTEERGQDFLYTDAVLTLETLFFMQKGSNFDWATIADLKDKKIGGVIGYTYGIEEAEKAGTVKINRISKPGTNYKKLASGRLDAVLEDTQAGLKYIEEMGFAEKIVAHPTPLTSRKYSVIISKNTPNAANLIEAFNKGLKKLKDSGRFEAILKAARDGQYDKK